LIWANREAVSFCKRDWTGQISLIRLKKLAAMRMPRIGLKGPLAVLPSCHSANKAASVMTTPQEIDDARGPHAFFGLSLGAEGHVKTGQG
jgi:hypothetical protein